MAKVYITSKQLVEILEISSARLIEIEKFFDDDPHDSWELKEGKDYRIVASSGLREYTDSGAYAIAKYLEQEEISAKGISGFFKRVREWITHAKEKIRKGFVRRKILENSSSLMKRQDNFWLSSRDVVAIFGTKPYYLSNMAECAKRGVYDSRRKTDKPLTLIEREDYDVFDDVTYYSLSGIYKLSLAFSQNLTKKNRQGECEDVGKEINSQVDHIVDMIKKREAQIDKAKRDAKKRDKQRCQVTRKKGNKIDKIPLAAHHLYSQQHYPLLADSIENLITISCEVHNEFHLHFMQGTHKGCTIDDFIDFVQQYYPDSDEVMIWLASQKLKLGKQEPIAKNKPPHVLYLPYSRVS